MSINPIDKFIEAGNVVTSRSSTLVPLQWNMAILAALMAFLAWMKAPFWLELCTFILLAFVVLHISLAYIHFMYTDVCALRSEQHNLKNKQIDLGVNSGSDPKDNEKE